jgi:hypothetical protein
MQKLTIQINTKNEKSLKNRVACAGSLLNLWYHVLPLSKIKKETGGL